MAPHPTSLVYRLRGLPSRIDSHTQAAELLSWVLEQEASDIEVCSLATVMVSAWTGTTKTATVMFEEMPKIVESSPHKDEWTIDHPRLRDSLILDSHFRGMTPLHDILPPHEHKYSCIAISGLSSHPFGSWQPRGGRKEFMWLRDEFPKHHPTIRVWIYGYDTNLADATSFQSISDLAVALNNHLEASDFASPSAPQILVLAHSLGGIVFKEAISNLARGGGKSIHVLHLIRGAILFGVPNLGMEQSHLQNLVQYQPNRSLVEDLAVGSPYLVDLDERFLAHKFNHGMNVIWAYETRTSEIVEIDQHGNIRRSATRRILVSRESATSNFISQNANLTIPINRDHSGIVKYYQNDEDCHIVLLKVGELVDSTDVPLSQASGSFPGLTTSENSIGSRQVWPGSDALSMDSSDQDNTAEMISSVPASLVTSSLHVPELTRRHEGIDIRSLYTFEWIFENEDLKFTRWLRSEEGFYWIQGKPGSGKSTLMKFVYGDPRTRQFLNNWKTSEEPIFASFFFHHRGSVLQKSLDGLLRSILVQILQQRPSLGSVLNSAIEELMRNNFPMEEQKLSAYLQSHEWKQSELWRMLCHILGQKEYDLDICFFFDALDEYDGSPEIIKDFLIDLRKESGHGKTNLKICFSSRSWDSFVQSFLNYPGFSVHEHTTHDIQTYCYETLGEYGADAGEVGALVPDITENARGVFLWAKLALRDLIEMGSCTTDLEVLRKKLKSIPRELKDYYEEIVKRCHLSLRVNAYVLLEVVTRSDQMITLPDVLLALACYNSPTFDACRNAIRSGQEQANHIRHSQKLVSNACGGLLEVTMSKGILYVQLMHQTVREFVLSPNFKILLLGNGARYQHENGHSFLAKFSLAQRGLRSSWAWEPSPSITRPAEINTTYHLKQAEMTTGKSQFQFLSSFNSVLLEAALGYDSDDPLHQMTYARFGLAAHFELATGAGLHLYLEEMIAKQHLDDKEKGVALIQLLYLHCSDGDFQLADSSEAHYVLSLLGFKLEDIPRELFRERHLGLVSRNSVIGLTPKLKDENGIQAIATRYPIEYQDAHDPHHLIHQSVNVIQVHEGLLEFVQHLLETEGDPDITAVTPFQSGAMICNPSFAAWVLKRDLSSAAFLDWSRRFIEWAVVFWGMDAVDEKTYIMTLALGESTFLILDKLEYYKELDDAVHLAVTNIADWPLARRYLISIKGLYEREACWEYLLSRDQLVKRLDKWYLFDDRIVPVNNALDGDAEDRRDRILPLIEHGTSEVEEVASHQPALETSRRTHTSTGEAISALRRTIRTRMRTAFSPDQVG